jgi:hypothetical protein
LIVIDVKAAEYDAVPSLDLQTTYDDNVYFKEVDDFIFRIAPALKLGAQTERTNVQVRAIVDILEYYDYSELDHVDQKYDLSFATKPSVVWDVGVSGTYFDDYTFRSALEESGLIADRAQRRGGLVEPFFSVALNDQNKLRGDYTCTNVQYSTGTYPDYWVHGGAVYWFRDLRNEKSRVITLVRVSRADYEQVLGDVSQQTYQGMLGFEHRFSETVAITLLAGGAYMESEHLQLEVTPSLSLTTTTVNEYDSTYVVDGTFRCKEERTSLFINANRDVDASTYGENILRERIRAGLGFQWTEKMKLNLEGSYYHGETKGVYQKEEYQTASVRPYISYRIGKDFFLRVGYRYTWTENQITDTKQDRNRVWIMLSKAWTLKH